MAQVIVPGVTDDGRRGRRGLTPHELTWKRLWSLVTRVCSTADDDKPGTVDFADLVPSLKAVVPTGQYAAEFREMVAKLEGHQAGGAAGMTAATLRRDVLRTLEKVVPSRVRYGLV